MVSKQKTKSVVRKDTMGTGFGIASFVCGIVGLVSPGHALGIIALAFGIIALHNPLYTEKRWMAWTGVILGVISILSHTF